MKKVFLKILQNSRENICARVSFFEAWNFIKKETLALMFSCEFCEISKNTFFTKHLLWLLLFNVGALIHEINCSGITDKESLIF